MSLSSLLTRRSRALACSALLVSACSITRPEGAYAPKEEEPTVNEVGFSGDAGATGNNPPPPNAGPKPPVTGGGGGDGGASSPDGGLSKEAEMLRPLLGKYLMRADMYSIASFSQLFVSLEVANKASNMVVGEVFYDEESKTLRLIERLCYQLFEHECRDGCDTWSTQVDSRVTPFFPYVTRELILAGDDFSSPSVSASLGFDGDPNDLPRSDADPRVWDLGGGESVREGVLTRIAARGVDGAGSVDCDVYTVQRFTSGFRGTLADGLLDGASAPFNTQGSDGLRVGATGDDASSCRSESGAVSPGPEPDLIRFHKVDADAYDEERFWACPAVRDFTGALR